MKVPSIAILASGNGSTAESLIRSCCEKLLNAQVKLVISNNPDAGVFERVRELNKEYQADIDAVHIGKQNYPPEQVENLLPGQQTAREESAIIEKINKTDIDLVLLLGYMKRIGLNMIKQFGWHDGLESKYDCRMLNTHPGLLPATKGLYGIYVQEFVIANNLPEAGQTLHAVAEEYDSGPIIAEHRIAVLPNETAQELFERVKETEKKYLPSDIGKYLQSQIESRTGG